MKKLLLLPILLGFLGATHQTSFGCTGILLKAKDGSVVPARTMEFGFDVRSQLLIIPKGTPLDFLSSMEGKTGLQIKAKYGFLGMNAVEKNIVLDGLNEAGLYLGCFYFNNQALKVLDVEDLLKQADGEVTLIPSEIPRAPLKVTLDQ